MEFKLSEEELFFRNSATNHLSNYISNEHIHMCIRPTKPADSELNSCSELFNVLDGINNLYPVNNLTGLLYTRQRSDGAAIDTEAAWSVCRLQKALAYYDVIKIHSNLRPSNVAYRFGDKIFPGHGLLQIRIPKRKQWIHHI